jgi:hypothetical protein
MSQNGNKSKSQAVPMPGHEAAAAKLRTKLIFLKSFAAEIAEAKKEFCRLAASVASQLPPGVSCLEFLDGEGGAIKVALPDYGVVNNRNTLDAKKLTLAQKLGIDLTDKTAVEESYVLTGDFFAWLKQLISSWQAEGRTLPEGCDHKQVTRLTSEGVAFLRELAKAGAAGATEFLEAALKSPSVGAK